MTRTAMTKPQGADLGAGPEAARDSGVRRGPAQPYPGEKARQGRIVLKTPRQRTIFIAGLAGAAVLALLLALLA